MNDNFHVKNFNTPKEIAAEFTQACAYRVNLPTFKFILLAVLGGMFISIGGLLTVAVAGGMPGVAAVNPGLVKLTAGALFPVGLILVVLAGGDLFTSDCAIMAASCANRQASFKALVKVWVLAYAFNFVGAQLVAFFLCHQAGLVSADPWQAYLHKLAYAKVSMPFYTVFIKGIGANWLVCLGAWLAFAAKDVPGKVIGIWIPVMIFVALGYEHCIANMFFIPAAIYSGADISWGAFAVNNLIPATIGNIAGGAGLVGMLYGYIYLKD